MNSKPKRKRAPITKTLEAFHASDREVLVIPVKVPDEYSTVNSAWSTWRSQIKRLKYSMMIRTVGHSMYIIKLQPDYLKDKQIRLCSNCMHSLEDEYYNPYSPVCQNCVKASKWEAK